MDENATLFETTIILQIILSVFGGISINCEVGERVNYYFELFYEGNEQCSWYKLPIKMQQMYSIFVSDTQQSKPIKCYGNIDCNRELFKKVLEINNNPLAYFLDSTDSFLPILDNQQRVFVLHVSSTILKRQILLCYAITKLENVVCIAYFQCDVILEINSNFQYFEFEFSVN